MKAGSVTGTFDKASLKRHWAAVACGPTGVTLTIKDSSWANMGHARLTRASTAAWQR
ncbi:hypothetical protein [Rhizobium azibense]|uniref:Uncharacterized protein n=1 Tax=Rhizobium azibense TaxID=1136135 RepID=A0A4R3RAK5_9HYPH|nr:hypothetical protein [Rhizobium azibense]TCU32398.1 hypothetical protein EV129_12041 [Rhizobium azibense]